MKRAMTTTIRFNRTDAVQRHYGQVLRNDIEAILHAIKRTGRKTFTEEEIGLIEIALNLLHESTPLKLPRKRGHVPQVDRGAVQMLYGLLRTHKGMADNQALLERLADEFGISSQAVRNILTPAAKAVAMQQFAGCTDKSARNAGTKPREPREPVA